MSLWATYSRYIILPLQSCTFTWHHRISTACSECKETILICVCLLYNITLTEANNCMTAFLCLLPRGIGGLVPRIWRQEMRGFIAMLRQRRAINNDWGSVCVCPADYITNDKLVAIKSLENKQLTWFSIAWWCDSKDNFTFKSRMTQGVYNS